MKKITFIMATVFALVCGVSGYAQTAPDYFVGKWNTTVFGTPNGDAKMVLNLNRVDGKLTGTIVASQEEGTALPISELEEKPDTITVFFTAAGYQVSLTLAKKDDDHLTGNMLGMFTADGERVKEVAK